MTRLWLSFAVVVSSAPAQAATGIITDPDMACRLAYKRDGAWVKTDFLRQCLTLDNDNRILATLNDTLMGQAESITMQLKKMEERYAEMEATATMWEKQAKAFEAMHRSLETDLEKWHRQPAVVALIAFSVGVMVATITAVAFNNLETGL